MSVFWTTMLLTVLGTIVVFALVGLIAIRRMKSTFAEVEQLQHRVMPELERLQRGVEAAAEQWERIPADNDDAVGATGSEPSESR